MVFRPIFVATIALVLSGSVNAATVVYDSSGDVTGINSLTVNSTAYNVAFTTDRFDNLWPVDNPTFWGSATDAATASDAINVVLNGESPDPLIAPNTNYYFVPYADSATLGSIDVRYSTLDFGWQRKPDLTRLSTSPWSYAVFSPVPLPAAAWLFGSALLGLAAVKRKKT